MQIIWDDGNTQYTDWEFINDKLYFRSTKNNKLIRQYIFSSTSNYFSYREEGTLTKYSAYRISN